MESENSQETQNSSPLEAIKEKYSNNIDVLAEAYRNMQSTKDKLSNQNKELEAKMGQYLAPESYEVSDEYNSLGESNIFSLTETAKKGAYTQSQFEALLSSVNDFQQTAKEAEAALAEERKSVIGDDKAGLKDFYTTRLPEDLVDSLLDKGSIEQINALKDFRKSQLNIKVPNPGVNMSDNVADVQEAIADKRSQIQEIAKNLSRLPLDEKNSANHKIRRLSNEIVQLQNKNTG